MKYYSKEIKEQILSRIKNDGITAVQAARDAGVNVKSVYYWLSKGSDGANSEILEINRLKRQNKELLELVGTLSLQITKERRGKKD